MKRKHYVRTENHKRFGALFMAICLFACFAMPTIYAYNADENLGIETLYTAEEVAYALVNASAAKGQKAKVVSSILDDVMLPASMGIDIPHINMDKIVKSVRVATLDSAFQDALEAHGIEMTDTMTFSEYTALESTWTLPEDYIAVAKRLYPELKDVDMSTWTYGQFKDYYVKRDKELLIQNLSAAELQELDQRGIQTSDLMYLYKEYHTIENILNQTDAALKETIEGYYQFTLDKVMASVTRANPPADLYTEVDMPRYGTDYFLNDVLTNEYWRGIQADRTLKAQQVLYNSTSTTLKCTNMYGTYSYSQGGAHEGIDFTCPSGASKPTIYALFDGVNKKTSTTHQLSVYDENSPDEPKTYTYLHMSSITAGNDIVAGDAVGKQGKEGNATGYHVHFEVHAGETTSLSSEKDHKLGSISPYRLQDYIGELD